MKKFLDWFAFIWAWGVSIAIALVGLYIFVEASVKEPMLGLFFLGCGVTVWAFFRATPTPPSGAH